MSTRYLVAVAAAAIVSTAPALAQDQMKLATDSGCTACHAIDKKVIGPAYKEVAKKYKGDAKAPAVLADKVIKGGQGVWGPIPMPPNPKITPDVATKLVAWIMTL